jgi:hypothetical protein
MDITVEPAPGSYLVSKAGDSSEVVLREVQVEYGVCEKDYYTLESGEIKIGDPCLVVSGNIQNLHKEYSEIAMYAEGYDKAGKQVAWTLDSAHLLGVIALGVEYEETVEFTLHLNYSKDVRTVSIYAASYAYTPP